MNKIKIKPYTREELQRRGLLGRGTNWVTVERKKDCEIRHEGYEEIYILKGAGTIVTSKGEIHSIGVGDHIMIKNPVRCTWHIISPIKFKSRYF